MVKPSIMEFKSKQFGSSGQNEGKGAMSHDGQVTILDLQKAHDIPYLVVLGGIMHRYPLNIEI